VYHSSLAEDQHRDAQMIGEKAADIKQRFSDNESRYLAVLNIDSVRYYQFLEDCDELKEWLEYKRIQAQDESYRDTKNIHMKYFRHKGFESEFQANRNRLDRLELQANNLFNLVETSSREEATTSSSDESSQHAQVTGTGIDLIRAQIKEDISKRISELNKQWDDLQEITKLKGEKLFDANCGILFEQSVYSIDIWIKEMERNIQYTTQRTLSDAGDAKTSVEASDLTTTNLLLD
jgi:spectrin beta